MKIKIAAKVDTSDEQYFESEIKPMLNDPLVEFIEEIGEDQKSEFLGNAIALLFPIDWPEPFGLVMIEAMACGTPTIAYRGGSVEEVIDDGVTGFVVESLDEAVDAAVEKLPSIDRRKVRQVFEERFSVSRMASDYVQVYQRLISGHKKPISRIADDAKVGARH
jgi:glycosyltransferase involved in cell wall biosynthesis